MSRGELLYGRAVDIWNHVQVVLGVLSCWTFIVTVSVDNLIDFMGVIWILGIVLYHLEAHGKVVQSTAEVCFPPCLVVWELVYFPARHCPGPKYLIVLIVAVLSGVVLPGDFELVLLHIAKPRVLARFHLLYQPAGKLRLRRAERKHEKSGLLLNETLHERTKGKKTNQFITKLKVFLPC